MLGDELNDYEMDFDLQGWSVFVKKAHWHSLVPAAALISGSPSASSRSRALISTHGSNWDKWWYADIMTFAVVAEPIPLETSEDGVIRVGGTRIPLETVVHGFNNGATPEEIVQDFPVLRLDDIYAVITYCLRHREEVAAYLKTRQAQAEEVRRRVESRYSQTGLRKQLRARLGRSEASDLDQRIVFVPL